MPILVKTDDVRSGRKGQGSSQAVTTRAGLKGLNLISCCDRSVGWPVGAFGLLGELGLVAYRARAAANATVREMAGMALTNQRARCSQSRQGLGGEFFCCRSEQPSA